MTQNESTTPSGAAAPANGARAMAPEERRAAFSLAAIFMLRMLGLFMVMPVFMLHADRYSGYSVAAAGFAFGVYGLTQALFQIPFGLLSDRLGRKRVMTVGLLIFFAGSVMAALADSMLMLTLGRALQGLGAIAGAGLALLADLTREEHRTKAMAIVGVSIGFSFALAMVLGPAVTAVAGLPGLFWLTAVLALGGIMLLYLVVPDPTDTHFHRDAEPDPGQFGRVLVDGQLLRLDFGVLALHVLITATFTVLPVTLRDAAGLADTSHWKFYLPVLALSVLAMAPFVVYAERRGRLKQVLLGAIAALLAVELGLDLYSRDLYALAALMVVFFTAFNLIEATLPSLVSRFAPADLKGTALGAFSTSQYLGAFLGGALGGWAAGRFGHPAVFAGGAAIAALWLVVAAGMRNPPLLSARLLSVGELSDGQSLALTARLRAVPGVVEAVVHPEDGIAYLKVEAARLDDEALRAIAAERA